MRRLDVAAGVAPGPQQLRVVLCQEMYMSTIEASISAAVAKEEVLAKCPKAQLSQSGLFFFAVTAKYHRARHCLILGTGYDAEAAWINAYEKAVLGLAVPFG
jgi:hypothetical protein